jgi:hypothetical protein
MLTERMIILIFVGIFIVLPILYYVILLPLYKYYLFSTIRGTNGGSRIKYLKK